jgi:Protein of unknown function (DUF2851)
MVMREELLHFIWRHRYFNQQALVTESGVPVQVLSPGEPHTDQGPDFKNARIRLGDRLCEGAVEIHVVTSDWVRHAHDRDRHYAETILHVVWVDDHRGGPPPGNIPILVLRERVSKLLLGRYERWMKSQGFVPCERQLPEVDEQVWGPWLQTLAEERLRRKAALIRQCFEDTRQHWEATTWIWMARAMGLPVNGDVFEAVARTLPVELLARHREQRLQLEALLLGQAGLLNGPFTAHGLLALQREYHFLRTKWGLRPVALPVSFLRMRPANFPTVRLVQLAGLYSGGVGWFARIREAGSPREAWAGMDQLGRAAQDKLVINAFAPLLFTYGWIRGEPAYREKAMRWLSETRAEKNTLLTQWRRLGVVARHAGESQALLELKKEYCMARRCLECAIGNRWLISLVNNGERR